MIEQKCNDCGRTISDSTGRIKMCVSAKLGTYYDGSAICQRCADKRYEMAQAIKDAKEDKEMKAI